MKPWRLSFFFYIHGLLLFDSPAGAARGSPIEKIIGLITRLQGQLVQDEEAELAAYNKYTSYCQDSSFAKSEEIKSAKAEKAMLDAEILKSASDIKTSEGKIEDSSAGVAENQAKLKRATGIRAKEVAIFQGSEKELMGAIDMLGRAVDILAKEMAKSGSAALLQTSAAAQQLESVVVGLSAVIDGASLGVSEDLQKLTAMLQTHQEAEDGIDEQGGLADTEKPSHGIVEVLEDLRDKAEGQLRQLRLAEGKSIQNFKLLEQALTQETAQFQQELDDEKKAKSEAEKSKATAEGDLAITSKELTKGTEDYALVQHDCMRRAGDHDTTTAGRAEELKVLSKAKKTVQDSMAGSAASLAQTDESLSFMQTSSRSSRENTAGQHVVTLVQRLAVKQNSDSLKKLASRISAAIRYGIGAKTKDPFHKIKGLLNEMIKKLEREQNNDASEKEYCDREMKKTKVKREELGDDSEGLKTDIDQAASASTKLKSQAKDIQFELLTLAKLTQEMSTARRESHQEYLKDAEDLSQGLNGMRQAIHVLRDYYASDKEDAASFLQTDEDDMDSDAETAEDSDEQPEPPEQHEKSSGAGQGIIGLLEVIESKLAKNLAELQTEEDDAVTAFEKEMQESKISKTTKDQDVAYKTREYTALDKSVAELSSDHSTTMEELSAVNEYFAKVKDRCVAKPDKYEDRKARREEEIKGLEEAKSILESESGTFLQRRHR